MSIDPSAWVPAATAAGVWLWDSYGKDFVKWIGTSAWKKLKGKATKEWDEFKDWKDSAENYRREMLHQYNRIQILGMPGAMPLEGIFADTFLLDKPSAWRGYNLQELQRRRALGDEGDDRDSDAKKRKRYSGVELIQQKQRLYILGKPGAGKTTFLKYLTLQAVQGRQIDKVPIFVSLKEWSDDNTDLMTFMVKQFRICNFPDAEPFIEYLLEHGKALVLFDGLDEVNLEGKKRDAITRAIKDFANQYGKAHIALTCRVAANEYQFDFDYMELADFTPEQAKLFVQKWFRNDLEPRDKFFAEFNKDENKGIRDLARTPLLLTLLCIGFDDTHTFPPRRVEIYEDAIEALLKKWDNSRKI